MFDIGVTSEPGAGGGLNVNVLVPLILDIVAGFVVFVVLPILTLIFSPALIDKSSIDIS